MIINKSYKFRLYPDEDQVNSLLQHIGNNRFLWNKLVEFNKKYKEINNTIPNRCILQKEIVNIKKEHEFVKLSHSQPLQINAKRLHEVNVKSIKAKTIKERNKKIAIANTKPTKYRNKCVKNALNYSLPNFKKKSDMSGSLFYPQNFKLKKSRVFLAKLGWIKYIKHRNIQGNIKSVTLIQHGLKWHISVCTEVEIELNKNPLKNLIGIDVGLKEFATFSDGTSVTNPRTIHKFKNKLAKQKKKLAKMKFTKNELCSNRDKQKEKIRRTYSKITNTRKDFLHKLTHDMINKYDGFFIETLDIKNMLQNNNSRTNRNINDVSWYEFCEMLKYKSKWNNKVFYQIDKYFASSQICNKCKNKQNMPVNIREYNCDVCNTSIDRDLNAALNILEEGLNTAGTAGINACGDETLVSSMKQEKREILQAIA